MDKKSYFIVCGFIIHIVLCFSYYFVTFDSSDCETNPFDECVRFCSKTLSDKEIKENFFDTDENQNVFYDYKIIRGLPNCLSTSIEDVTKKNFTIAEYASIVSVSEYCIDDSNENGNITWKIRVCDKNKTLTNILDIFGKIDILKCKYLV